MNSNRVEHWIRGHVEPVAAIETTHERPWATVLRVRIAGGVAWFKACAQVRAFEPRLSTELHSRCPIASPRYSRTTKSGRRFYSRTLARRLERSAIRRKPGWPRCRCTRSSSEAKPLVQTITSRTACRI